MLFASCDGIKSEKSVNHIVNGVNIVGKWMAEDEDGVNFYWELTADGYLKYYETVGDVYAEVKDGVLYENGCTWSLEMKGRYITEDNTIFFEGIKGATILETVNEDEVKVHMFYNTDEIVTIIRIKSIKPGEAPRDPLNGSIFMSRDNYWNLVVKFESDNSGYMKALRKYDYAYVDIDFSYVESGSKATIKTKDGDTIDITRIRDRLMKLEFVSGDGVMTHCGYGSVVMKRVYSKGGNTKIFYESSDNNTVDPRIMDGYNAKGVKLSYVNTYDSSFDLGTIEFNGVVETLSMSFACDTVGLSNLRGFDGVSNTVKMKDARFDLVRYKQPVHVTNFFFYYCDQLQYADLMHLDTSEITDLGFMFFGCSSLTGIDIRGFNTENVKSMYSMFNGCTSLYGVLDLNHFNFKKVTNFVQMFRQTTSLSTVLMEGFDYSDNIEYVNHMFWDSGVTTIKVGYDYSSFVVPNDDAYLKSRYGIFLPKKYGKFYYKKRDAGENWYSKCVLGGYGYYWELIPY